MTTPPPGKSATALRTIGEVVAETGVAAHVLRYWERQVPALQPVRRAGDRRYYRPDDVALIVELARLIHQQGYTLDGAARAVEVVRRGSAVPLRQPVADHATEAVHQPAAPSAALSSSASVPAMPFAGWSGASPGGAISLARLRQLRDRLQTALDQYG